MERNPLVSIIVPIYNVEKRLEICLKSILGQTHKNLEIILVDDGSPDNCGKICDEYAKKDSRIKVIHQENGGLSRARNSGIDIACGEYLAFIDSDDYVADDYIEFMLNNLLKTGADISACGALFVHPSGKTERQYDDDKLYVIDKHEALRRMCYNDGFFVTAWDKLYKKELFSTVRYNAGKVFEDTGTTYKVVDKAEKIVFQCIPKYFYIISEDNSSITKCTFNEKKLDYVEMADEMAEYIKAKHPDLTAAAERKQMHACFSTLTQLVNSNTRNKPVEKMLVSRINALKKGALKNPYTPLRDKIGILCLTFGFRFFSFAWKMYSLRKR